MKDFDYSGKPLQKGPAQKSRDLEPKLTPTEPSKDAKKRKDEKVNELKKKLGNGEIKVLSTLLEIFSERTKEKENQAL